MRGWSLVALTAPPWNLIRIRSKLSRDTLQIVTPHPISPDDKQELIGIASTGLQRPHILLIYAYSKVCSACSITNYWLTQLFIYLLPLWWWYTVKKLVQVDLYKKLYRLTWFIVQDFSCTSFFPHIGTCWLLECLCRKDQANHWYILKTMLDKGCFLVEFHFLRSSEAQRE